MRAIARHTSIFRAPIARPFLFTVARSPIAATRSIGSYQKTPTSNRSFTRKQVANMSSESTQSQACCNTPAVVSKGYSPKGDYIEVDGLKTCKLLNHTASILSNVHFQTPRAPKKQNKASSSSTTSSASSTKRSRAPTFSPTQTKTTHTKSSCQISSKANLPISHGTLQTTKRRARS
jgi:hypothetical protein